MLYTKKLTTAFDIATSNPLGLLLDEDEQILVSIAATTAYRLGLSQRTFGHLLGGLVTEDEAICEMRRTLLTETSSSSSSSFFGAPPGKPKSKPGKADDSSDYDFNLGTGGHSAKRGGRPDSNQELIHTSAGHRVPSKSYDDQLDALDKQRADLLTSRDDQARADRDNDLRREEDAFDPSGETSSKIYGYADKLVKHLVTVPKDDRAVFTKKVIDNLIGLANKMLHKPDDYAGDATHSWRIRPKYRPRDGMKPTTKTTSTARESQTVLAGQQTLLEEIVINELFGALRNLFNRVTGRGKATKQAEDGDVTPPSKPATKMPVAAKPGARAPVAVDTPNSLLAGIIQALREADITPYGRTAMLQNVIKYIMKGVGAHFKHSKSNPRDKIIDGYVDKILAAQKDKPTKSFSINVKTMAPDAVKRAVAAYRESLARHGYDSNITQRPGGIIEFILQSSKTSSEFESPTDRSNTTAPAEAAADEARTRGIKILGTFNSNGMVVGRDEAGDYWRVNTAGDWEKLPPDERKTINTRIVSAYSKDEFTPGSGWDNKAKQNNTGEALGLNRTAEAGAAPRVVGHLVKDGRPRPDLKVAIGGTKAYVFVNGAWKEMKLELLKRLWAGETVDGYGFNKTMVAPQTDTNHRAAPRGADPDQYGSKGVPSMLNTQGARQPARVTDLK